MLVVLSCHAVPAWASTSSIEPRAEYNGGNWRSKRRLDAVVNGGRRSSTQIGRQFATGGRCAGMAANCATSSHAS